MGWQEDFGVDAAETIKTLVFGANILLQIQTTMMYSVHEPESHSQQAVINWKSELAAHKTPWYPLGVYRRSPPLIYVVSPLQSHALFMAGNLRQ